MGIGPLLLDTHALVWAVTTPTRLGSEALKAIEDPANDVFVSAAAAWELAIKFQRGQLPEGEILVRAFDDICARLRVRTLSITTSHAISAGTLSWQHRDPFDRMLAAQSLQEGMTLVSIDRAFRRVPSLRTLW